MPDTSLSNHDLSLQIVALDGKLDRVLELIPKVEDHEKRVQRVEDLGHPDTIRRVDLLEKAHWKMLGGASALSAAVSYIVMWWKGHV